jgi:hypothetical protein
LWGAAAAAAAVQAATAADSVNHLSMFAATTLVSRIKADHDAIIENNTAVAQADSYPPPPPAPPPSPRAKQREAAPNTHGLLRLQLAP